MNLIKNNPGFILGLVAFLIILFLPASEGLNPQAQRTLALFVLMGTWWATEAVPVAITALVPLALFPLFGKVFDGKKNEAKVACAREKVLFPK